MVVEGNCSWSTGVQEQDFPGDAEFWDFNWHWDPRFAESCWAGPS